MLSQWNLANVECKFQKMYIKNVVVWFKIMHNNDFRALWLHLASCTCTLKNYEGLQ